MESSPIAAMQPSSHMPAWARNDLYTSHPHAHMSNITANSFGPGAFDFRDLSMKHSKSDYFLIKPVRGSSPTASLAADLSQNFHIDMSPQLPTPRRSLFTSNLFGTLDGRDCVTTPPLPSSSPGPLNERMDISPLPHKQPYFCAQIEIPSPTPAGTTTEDTTMGSSPIRPSLLDGSKPFGAERRKNLLLRPTFSRTKGHSSSSLSRQNVESQLPPFRFGAGSSKLSTSTTSMSLGECFMESPPRERRSQSANSPTMAPPPRLSKPFSSVSSRVVNGSPIGSHSRRTSNPLVRPRKQFRRSLSMFESPQDIVKEKESTSSSLHTVMDIDEIHQPILPHFFQEGQPDSIPRIAKETLLEILDGKYDDEYDQRMIVDCRFEYEFEGGHIDGAVNYNDKELLTSQLFETSIPGKTLLIFHCEYSAHRAPIMARHVRQQDRTTNVEQYPKLSYPEVYILDGGYSAFFTEHQGRCFPQNYVEMDAKEHAYTCEREMGRLRHNRTKLSRAHTYAIGQHGQIDDSPTAPSRSKSSGSMLTTEMTSSPIMSSPIFYDRGPRRQVSY
ncbi:e56d127f-d170-4fcd-a9d3-82de1d748a83 [Sclerotinia trifoliorum]|uniref:M-phase inducer phosphatase n=1 Tax=Sclerotinia trifoliorum TaxID=28548 RepID=A0A8H2W6I0_9HELO|nr:e56d127f-d170-4fcd-a9d3-82de1d748a83 [Sclerotinia trifoliorum]